MTVQTRADIDQQAHEIARQAVDGELEGRTARAMLAELVHRSGVAVEVSMYEYTLNVQARSDVAESVAAKLAEWVLDEDDPFFSLEHVATGSLCGWARQCGLQIVRRHDAVRPRRLAREVSLVDPVPPMVLEAHRNGPYRSYHLSQAFAGASSEELFLTEAGRDMAQREERVLAEIRGARLESRPRVIASTLRRELGLPALCVPRDDTDREFVRSRCEADPLLAARSWRTMLDILEDPQLGRSATDERLLSLWDDYSVEDLLKLEKYPPSAIQMIVVGSLAPAPKMSRGALRTMTRLVKAKRNPCTRPWQELVTALVASYVAQHTRAISEFDDTSDEISKAAMRRAAALDAAQWPDVLERAMAFPGAPLGTDPEDVEAELAEAMAAALEDEVEQRLARVSALR